MPDDGPRADPASEAAPPSGTRDLAGALHEVSNALTVILGWIASARVAIEDGTDGVEALEVAAGRARQARQIVRRAIGAEVPDDAPASLAAVVRDAVLGLEPEARGHGIGLTSRVSPRAALVTVENASTVVQILTNLLLNAIGVSHAGASVLVEAVAETPGAVTIAVSDEGPGIPPERRAALLEAGISTRPGGAGIGLKHAAALAREGGGVLSLAPSERGARFELRWPASMPDARPPSPSTRTLSARLAGARILVVEDDQAVIDLLDTALSARGAAVICVKRRSEIAAALATGVFDAALLDVSPIQDDFAGTLLAVRAGSPAARLIVISGSAVSLPDVPAGCDVEWVRKPFEIAEIVRAVAAR